MVLKDLNRKVFIKHISDLNEIEAISMIHARLNNDEDPLQILKDCQEGMRQVGERYEQEEYFISGLIMAGEIFRQAMELIQPVVRKSMTEKGSGRILLGTVEGDIHDLGKDMVGELLSCHGFHVYDLGVDVTAESFLEGATEVKPDIIGMSILMTNALDFMRDAVKEIRNSSVDTISRIPVIIGGSLANDDVCKFAGADYWVNDAMEGVRVCLKLKRGEGF